MTEPQDIALTGFIAAAVGSVIIAGITVNWVIKTFGLLVFSTALFIIGITTFLSAYYYDTHL